MSPSDRRVPDVICHRCKVRLERDDGYWVELPEYLPHTHMPTRRPEPGRRLENPPARCRTPVLRFLYPAGTVCGSTIRVQATTGAPLGVPFRRRRHAPAAPDADVRDEIGTVDYCNRVTLDSTAPQPRHGMNLQENLRAVHGT